MSKAKLPTGMIPSLCRCLLNIRGWQLNTEIPQADQYVLVAYPHTSNWDFVLAMLAKAAVGFHFHWVAKHTLFWWPLGLIMRALGGIEVDRRKPNGLIEQLAKQYKLHDKMVIAITPEGTRSYRPHWKSGFYHLALQAKVPIALAYIDHNRKEIGISSLMELSGDMQKDLEAIKAFYADKPGRYPEKAGPICFKQP